jgi:hypothetical protein
MPAFFAQRAESEKNTRGIEHHCQPPSRQHHTSDNIPDQALYLRVSVMQMIPSAYSNHLPEGFSKLMVGVGCGKLYQGMSAGLNSLLLREFCSETSYTSSKTNGGMGA